MQGCLIRVFVFLVFFYGTSLPLGMILIGPTSSPEIEQLNKKFKLSQLTKEEQRRLTKLKQENAEKFRSIAGTLPCLTFPAAMLLTFLTFMQKKTN